MTENGNGHVGHLPVMEWGEPDEGKVSLLTTTVTAAEWYQEDRTKKAYQTLVGSIRDFLRQLLDREPAREEIDRVLRGEL